MEWTAANCNHLTVIRCVKVVPLGLHVTWHAEMVCEGSWIRSQLMKSTSWAGSKVQEERE